MSNHTHVRFGCSLFFYVLLFCCVRSVRCSLAFVSSKRSASAARTSTSVRRNSRLSFGISSISQLDGLLDKDRFEENSRLDETLVCLKRQLPNILTVPLTRNSASRVYSDDIVIVGPKGEVLSRGIDELVTLSTTLVAGTVASQTAQRALKGTFSDDNVKDFTAVNCELVWDTKQRLFVKWKSTLQLIGGRTATTEGLSELNLDENGRISTLKLLDVSLDGRTIMAVGEALANIRSAVLSVPFPKDSPLLGAIAEVRDGLLAAAQQPFESQQLSTPTPLYVSNSTDESFLFPPKRKAPNAITLDEYNNLTVSPRSTFPLPGSVMWQDYVSSHKALSEFWTHDIPILAGQVTIGIYDGETACNFAPNATLVGPDIQKTQFLKGGNRIEKSYKALASLRRASNGKWSVKEARADWRAHTLDISWTATIPTGITTIEGKDQFVLNEDDGSVETVQQLQLSVGGNKIVDPEPIKAFWVALEASDGVVPGGDLMSDLIRRLGSAGSERSSSATSASAYQGPPELDDEAAASVYTLMCALHRDLSNIQNLTISPASLFLTDEISLRGYMGESIAKGSSSYRQTVGVAIASLRGAIRSNAVSLQEDPSATIQFTPSGNLKVTLFLNLMANPLATTLPPIGTLPMDSGFGSVGQVPLKIELVSAYILNKEGKVQEHRLLESRINGQLTPGDVVTRWIKGILSSSTSESNDNNGRNVGISTLMDMVTWARSIGGSSSAAR